MDETQAVETTGFALKSIVGRLRPAARLDGSRAGEGHEFLHEATQVKNIWVPTGE